MLKNNSTFNLDIFCGALVVPEQWLGNTDLDSFNTLLYELSL